MAKKKKKKKAVRKKITKKGTAIITRKKTASRAARPTPTRCEQGGPELLPVFITVRRDDAVELKLTLCKSAFDVKVTLDSERLVDQTVIDGLALLLPPLLPGRHALHWAFHAASEVWQVKSEVGVDDVVRFRQRKGHDSDSPINHTFLILEVV